MLKSSKVVLLALMGSAVAVWGYRAAHRDPYDSTYGYSGTTRPSGSSSSHYRSHSYSFWHSGWHSTSSSGSRSRSSSSSGHSSSVSRGGFGSSGHSASS